jgi:hypothetical protein
VRLKFRNLDLAAGDTVNFFELRYCLQHAQIRRCEINISLGPNIYEKYGLRGICGLRPYGGMLQQQSHEHRHGFPASYRPERE